MFLFLDIRFGPVGAVDEINSSDLGFMSSSGRTVSTVPFQRVQSGPPQEEAQ